MKALTIHEPWATLLAHGRKMFETRGWDTAHRGALAIHAGRRWDGRQEDLIRREPFRTLLAECAADLPPGELLDAPFFAGDVEGMLARNRGRVLAVAQLTGVVKIDTVFAATVGGAELELGDWSPGRFAWRLSHPRRPTIPIAVRGRQGLWDLPGEVERRLRFEEAHHGRP